MGTLGRKNAWIALVALVAAGCAAEEPAGAPSTLASAAAPLSICTAAADCDDGDACTTDRCVEGQCVLIPITTEGCCNDVSECSPGACEVASCVQREGRPYGVCGYSPEKGCCVDNGDCDDRDLCTQDFCDPTTSACGHEPIDGCCTASAQCDDGNACTVGRCIANACVSKVRTTGGCCATDAHCDDGDPCTANTCDPMAHACVTSTKGPDGKLLCCETTSDCDDGNACTNEVCADGECLHQPVSCDDGDECTADACDPTGECVHTATCGIPGDSCEGPLPVGPLPFQATGDTTLATKQHMAPEFCAPESAYGSASSDLVWVFTPKVSGDYLIEVAPDGFDALLYIQTGCVSGVTCQGASDVLGAAELESVVLTATEGTTYFIVVDGYNDFANEAGAFTLTVEALAPPNPGVLVINEVDYDQPGTDTTEFIEIYNPGPAPADLSRWKLEHVNGSNGTVVFAVNLSDAGATLPAGGYLVLGTSSALPLVAPGALKIQMATNFLQNGAPDGARLLLDGVFFDGMAWEGTMAGTGEGTTAGADTGAEQHGSLSRCPNGVDTDDNGADFEATPSTPGAASSCGAPAPTFAPVNAVFQTKCTPCHSSFGSGGHNMGSTDVGAAYSDSQLASYYVPGATKGAAAYARIKNGSMPQGAGCTGDPALDAGKPACLTASEQATVKAWIDGGQLAP